MNNNLKKLKALKETFLKGQYIRRSWTTSPDEIFTIEEYAEVVEPKLKNAIGEAIVVLKKRKDGGCFLKVEIPLKDGSVLEYDLTYEKHDDEDGFEEGDELDFSTLKFCMERSLDAKHPYVTGELAD